jgi:hypothetical protein
MDIHRSVSKELLAITGLESSHFHPKVPRIKNEFEITDLEISVIEIINNEGHVSNNGSWNLHTFIRRCRG